jgi:hypothetical protein
MHTVALVIKVCLIWLDVALHVGEENKEVKAELTCSVSGSGPAELIHAK